MKLKFIYYLTFILFSIKLYAQSPIADSIIKTTYNDSIFENVGNDSIIINPRVYWNVNDKKKYNVSTKETKIEGDTINLEEEYFYTIYMEVESVYQDETIIKWSYRNLEYNSKSFLQNPFSLADNVSISFKIDQDGRFLGYTNIDQTINQLALSSENLENKFLDKPDAIALIKKNMQKYSTKENIVKLFDKDIRQFHHFFGQSQFSLKGADFTYKSYMDNLFSTSPTPATTTLKLYEISPSNTNYIMGSVQEADKDWLANSWFSYLKDLATKLGTEQPTEDRLKDDISYCIKTTSRIKDNGWISYSIETKKVKFQDTNYTLERRFELVN